MSFDILKCAFMTVYGGFFLCLLCPAVFAVYVRVKWYLFDITLCMQSNEYACGECFSKLYFPSLLSSCLSKCNQFHGT